MNVPTESFEIIRERLSEALAWVVSLKLNLPHARHASYLASLDRIIEATKDHSRPLNSQEGLVTLFEVHALNEIFLARNKIGSEKALRSKLQTMLSGTLSYKDERGGAGALARNTAFELVTAATFGRSGYLVELPECGDLTVQLPGKDVPIECKRASSAKKLNHLVGNAIDQLNARSAGLPSASPGIVSVDVTKLINPHFAVYECEVLLELTAELSRICNDMAMLPVWSAPKTATHLGAMCRFSLVAHVRALGFYTHCAQWALIVFSNAPPQYQQDVRSLFTSLRAP